MKYLRLLVVAIVLLGVVFVLYQCADTSALDTPAPAVKK
jgi:hypothetical protein